MCTLKCLYLSLSNASYNSINIVTSFKVLLPNSNSSRFPFSPIVISLSQVSRFWIFFFALSSFVSIKKQFTYSGSFPIPNLSISHPCITQPVILYVITNKEGEKLWITSFCIWIPLNWKLAFILHKIYPWNMLLWRRSLCGWQGGSGIREIILAAVQEETDPVQLRLQHQKSFGVWLLRRKRVESAVCGYTLGFLSCCCEQSDPLQALGQISQST